MPLTVTAKGTGGGTVSVNGVVVCSIASGQPSSTCTKLLDYGATASITASPAAASSLDGVSGDCTGAVGCAVLMTAARAIDATFTLRQVSLTLILSGSGSGVVSVDGTAVCTLSFGSASPVTCTRMANLGSTSVIAAQPASGSTFDGYGADCAGAPRLGTTCNLGISGPRTVTVVFSSRIPPAAGVSQPAATTTAVIKPAR